MKLQSLTIGQLPGINRRIEVTGFGDGINFITGPNASGKTSLIRALGYLLSPRQKNDPTDLILEAEFEIDGASWTVVRTAGDPVWRTMGQMAERPNVASQDLLDCHLIRIEDLITLGQGNDKVLAETLQREMDGGLDLRTTRQRLAKQVDFKAMHQNREVIDARDALNQIRNEHRALAAQQQRLPELEQNIATAKKSQRELQAIEWAKEAVEHQQVITSLASDRAALPAVLSSLTGQELEQIEALEQVQRKRKDSLADMERAIHQLEAELDDTGMADEIPDAVLVQTVTKHLDAIRSIDQSISAESKQLAHDQAQAQTALERLGTKSGTEETPWPRLSVSDIDQAQTLARKIDRAHQMAQQTVSNKNPATANNGRWLIASSLVLSGLALVSLMADQPMVAIASVIGLMGLSLWRLLGPKTTSQAGDETVTQSIASLEAEAQSLAKKLGFEPALLSENASLVFADAYRQYIAAIDGLQAAEQAIAYNQSRLKQTREQLSQSMADFNATVSSAVLEAKNTTALQARLEDWLIKAERADAINKELKQLRHTQTELMDELNHNQASMAAIYRSANLPMDAKEALRAHLSKRSAWQEIENKLAKEQALLDDRMMRLKPFPDLVALIEIGDQIALEDAFKKHQSASDQLERLQEEHIRLQQAIELASKGDRLTKATSQLDQAIDELNAKRTEALEAQAGLFWLNAINEQTRADSGDRTFDQARALFLTFTHHQWALELEETFVARRTSDQAPIPLSQLSTATRMQLLLAVRMARVLKAETDHHTLPVFIDEALTTSDPERAAAIIDNLQTIAAEQDRQIIYLAASDYELQLWHHLTDQHPTRIELGKPSVGFGQATPPLPLSFAPSAVAPPPNGQSVSEYANTLGIAPLSRFTSVDDLPLFYVLADDLDLLHELMSVWRLTTLGPFERWLQTPPAKSQFEPSLLAGFKKRCQVTRRWWSAWHQGHAKPITEGILHQALDGGGLTDATLSGVIEAAQAVAFNGAQLLSYLEAHPIAMAKSTRRISTRQLNVLREFLEAQGHLPMSSALMPEQCRQRALEPVPSDTPSAERLSLGALIDRLEVGSANQHPN